MIIDDYDQDMEQISTMTMTIDFVAITGRHPFCAQLLA